MKNDKGDSMSYEEGMKMGIAKGGGGRMWFYSRRNDGEESDGEE